MTDNLLIIGNKNYSSWSLRGWLAVKLSGIAFEEKVIPLFHPQHEQTMQTWTPAGKVPVLRTKDGDIWESLAICEYLAEIAPEAGLWPVKANDRAFARSISAEMAAGFFNLRREFPMNCRRKVPGLQPGAECRQEIARIHEIWGQCLQAHSHEGPFLFGKVSIADVMYAPVVCRFNSYGLAQAPQILGYMRAVLELPDMLDWFAAAAREPWTIEGAELGLA